MRQIIILLFIIIIACQPNQINFNQTKWKNGCADGFCDDRELMVSDLMRNYLKVGMPKSEVISLLGNPNFVESDDSIISYDVFIGYNGIDPNEGKTLQIIIKDSIVANFKLKHWKAD